MAHRIVLIEDFEDLKAGVVHIVTSTKLGELKKQKVKFNTKLKSGVGSREYEFETPPQPKESKSE